MVLNKGLLEIGGVAVPNTLMANNKTEARERAEREGLYFAFAFLAPFAFVKFFNKSFLKQNKISPDFKSANDKIMSVSKEYLTKDGAYLEQGINKTLESLKAVKHKDYESTKKVYENILKKFPDKEDLRKKLINTHCKVVLFDFLLSGMILLSIPWLSNFITSQKTHKSGFSAKFEMVDEKTRKKDAEQFEKTKNKRFAAVVGAVIATGLGLFFGMKKGLNADKTSKFGNFVKKNITKLDYKDGIFMSRIMLLLISLCSDTSSIVSSRDKDELKYSAIRNIAIDSMFFGGDLIINAFLVRITDKLFKTKLLDKDKLKDKNTLWNRITCPVKTFKQLDENKMNLDAKTLKRTKIAGVAMFWSNFAILCGLIGFGLPFTLNKMLKENVQKEK